MAYGSLNSPRGVETEEERKRKLAQQAEAQRMLQVNNPLSMPAMPHQHADYRAKIPAQFEQDPFKNNTMDQLKQIAMMKGINMGFNALGFPMSGGGKVPAYAEGGTKVPALVYTQMPLWQATDEQSTIIDNYNRRNKPYTEESLFRDMKEVEGEEGDWKNLIGDGKQTIYQNKKGQVNIEPTEKGGNITFENNKIKNWGSYLRNFVPSWMVPGPLSEVQ